MSESVLGGRKAILAQQQSNSAFTSDTPLSDMVTTSSDHLVHVLPGVASAPDDITAGDSSEIGAYVILGLVVMVIINCAALFGNLAVFSVILKTAQLRCQLTYLFVLNLCLADLLNSIIVLPITTASFAFNDWIFGDAFCYAHGILTSSLMFVSILSLCVISIERYYSIRMPMHYAANMTLARTLAILAYVWIQSIVVAFLPLFGWNSYAFRHSKAHCSYSWSEDSYHKLYVVFASILCFVLPGSIMAVMYSAIFRVAKKTARQIHPSQMSHTSCSQNGISFPVPCSSQAQGNCASQPSSQEDNIDTNGEVHYDVTENPKDGISTICKTSVKVIKPLEPKKKTGKTTMSKSYMINLNFLTHSTDGSNSSGALPGTGSRAGHWKAVKTLMLIMTIFMVLWAPYFILHLHGVFRSHVPPSYTLELVFTWLGFSSYAINPVIYGWLNRSIREALSNTLDQIKMALFPNPEQEEDWSTSEDFFQFLERTSTTRTLSVPHGNQKSNNGVRTPPANVDDLRLKSISSDA